MIDHKLQGQHPSKWFEELGIPSSKKGVKFY